MLDPNLSGIEENDRKEETEADCGDQRFEKELEFVSCLTNPQYLQCNCCNLLQRYFH
ncbi:MAG: hypothetical protein MHMPM18_003700 [Marteilia pararefringens]